MTVRVQLALRAVLARFVERFVDRFVEPFADVLVDRFLVPLFAVVLRVVLRDFALVLVRDFALGLGGTLPPSRRASASPIAMACFLLVTFLPEPPDSSVPRFRSCIAFSTVV